MRNLRAAKFMLIALLGFGAPQVVANEIEAPNGPVLLQITGDIALKNVDDALAFDRESLMSLDSTSFETNTVWTDGIQSFEGVSLHVLTELLGAESGTLHATAVNDYTVEIPVSDAIPGGPIIAYTLNGAEMSVRDKGPLWIVYPFDSHPDYRTAVINSRSIWQLDRLHVVK